jgi:hypothetical protein
MLAALLPKYRSEWVFVLPGEPANVTALERVKDRPNTVRLVYEGAKMLAALQALADDDAFWRAQVAAGSDSRGPDEQLLNEKLFGTREKAQATLKPPLKPVFDWAQEAAQAQADSKAMFEKLQLQKE